MLKSFESKNIQKQYDTTQLLWEIANKNTVWSEPPMISIINGTKENIPAMFVNSLIWECKCEVNQGIKGSTKKRISSIDVQYHFDLKNLEQ